MDTLKKKWDELVDKNPKLAQWIREGGLFFVVSNLITIVRALLISILQPAFGFLGTGSMGFPNIPVNIFGIEFQWFVIGAEEKQGGAAYFAAFLISLWVCEIINFFLQRKFVFRSNGNMGRQFVIYFLAFALVTCIVNSINCVWGGVARFFSIPSIIADFGTTFITGGVAMVVFFFANRFIFKETEKKA